jgi:hypothetical protein
MTDIKQLEREHGLARDAFHAVATAKTTTREEYDKARDAYIDAMRRHHSALGFDDYQPS